MADPASDRAAQRVPSTGNARWLRHRLGRCWILAAVDDSGVVRGTVRSSSVSRVFATSFASVYPLYVAKLERKGRTKAELDQVIQWLTGFDQSALDGHLAEGTTFEDFFADASLNPRASLITGTVCGVRVENIEDPLMQKIRYLDKLVDELAQGKSMDKVLRT